MKNYLINEKDKMNLSEKEKELLFNVNNSSFFSLPKFIIDDEKLFLDVFHSFGIIVLYRIALFSNPFSITCEELGKLIKCSQSKVLEIMDTFQKNGYISFLEKFNMESGDRIMYISLDFEKLEKVDYPVEKTKRKESHSDQLLDPLYIENSEGLEFLKKIQNLGFTFTPSETRKILHLINESKAKAMSAYNRSSFLRGESDIKPPKSMFFKLSTWEKIAAFAYDDIEKKDDEPKNLSLSELRELERSKKNFGNLSEYLKNQKNR